MFNDKCQELRKMLANSKAIAVTTYGWSFLSDQAYMDFTVHFIDSNWQLVSKAVAAESLEKLYTPENIAHCIRGLLEKLNI